MAGKKEQFNWNEYQWGQEIRRDERRISCYFRELPSCLDLPGEEEMIFENLYSQVDLVPVNGKSDSLRSWEVDFDEEMEEDRPPHKLLIQLDKLAVDWNILLAQAFLPSHLSSGLRIVCLFGKLMVRLSNFFRSDAFDPGLTRSLGKHAVLDLNELAGALKALSDMEEGWRETIHLHLDILGHIRECLLEELRKVDEPF